MRADVKLSVPCEGLRPRVRSLTRLPEDPLKPFTPQHGVHILGSRRPMIRIRCAKHVDLRGSVWHIPGGRNGPSHVSTMSASRSSHCHAVQACESHAEPHDAKAQRVKGPIARRPPPISLAACHTRTLTDIRMYPNENCSGQYVNDRNRTDHLDKNTLGEWRTRALIPIASFMPRQ